MDVTAVAGQLLEAVPANRQFGVRVVRAADAASTVVIDDVGQMGNAIGSMHASGLIALIDAAGIAALLAAATDEDQLATVLPLGSAAELTFHRPAKGRLTATASVAGPNLDAARDVLAGRVRKTRLFTDADIVDESATLVCQGRFQWHLRRLADE